MDDILPSYEAANARDYWTLVARYMRARDLCAAALVCRQWHQIFTRQLWGNPASHFGIENDVVYVALARFKRTLAWARLSTRELTYVLHLPPAHAEVYGGPHSDWLRDVLERLPRLQSLIVSKLPFFDHAALVTLRRASTIQRSSLSDGLLRMPQDFPLFRLRYLDASSCANATYSGLAEALQHLQALLYLNLSRTKSAKDANVLSMLKYCHSLRVLKLRALALRDAEVEALATAVKMRLKSLDVRDNQLTDESARILLQNCFNIRKKSRLTHADGLLEDRDPLRLSPVSATSPGPNPYLFDQYDKEDLDSRLRSKLVGEFFGTAFIDETYDGGITHLYISNNNMTVEGFSGLLRSKRLHVFDAGTAIEDLTRPKSSLSFEKANSHCDSTMPGAESLTPIIERYGSGKLTYLRINHAVITEETSMSDFTVGRSGLKGDLGVYAPKDSHELNGFNEVYELRSESGGLHEVPANERLCVELSRDLPSTLSMRPEIIDSPQTSEARRGTFAPGVEPDLKCLAISKGKDAPKPVASTDTLASGTGSGTPHRRSSSIVAKDRRARLEQRQSTENYLHPGMASNIDTLVLTDVPTESYSPATALRLVQFVKDCAEETYIARLNARSAYALPPGRDRQVAEREYAHSQFALRRIVLEMAPAGDAFKLKRSTTTWRQHPTKSYTEDADSESFWSTAERDFSFFSDEESGIPDLEPGRALPLAATSGKMIMPSIAGPPPVLLASRSERHRPSIDVVAELSKFRKGRKAAYQAALAGGESDPEVEGYWDGDIAVVRPSLIDESIRGGDVDCAGNYYEKGYSYR